MKPKKSWRTHRIIVGATIAAIASVALTLAPMARSAIMADRQVAARALFPSNPDFSEPVKPGDTIADREFGQPDFLHNSSNFVDSQSLSLSTSLLNGVAVDQSSIPNRVYVSDPSNNRVLGWASAAALTNGQPANLVIGQADFFSNQPNTGGVSAATLSSPAGVAVDTSGNLYVADSANNRVLEYNSPFAADGTPGSGDTIADEVFGQGNSFTAISCNLGNFTAPPASAGTLCNPQGVGLDLLGNLYIADTGNNRVLAYLLPSINTIANVVYGQPDFFQNVASNGGVGATSLSSPEGVANDSSGNLYVADHSNSRVLEYNNPLHNTTANHVFGQISFNLASCNSPTESATSLCFPTGVAFDVAGRLYVGDQQSSRVLVYNSPLTSQTASRVFGQTSLTATGGCNNGNFSVPSASTLCSPTGVALDTTSDLFVVDSSNNRVLKYGASQVAGVVLGQPDFTHKTANEVDASALFNPNAVAFDNSVNGPRLYVADTSNNRVLGFKNPSTFLNGGPANVVIGQADFFSNNANQPSFSVGATGLSAPQGVAVDKSGNLYVADTGNNRILRYAAPITTNGRAANLVIGQANFISNGCNRSAAIGAGTLCTPVGVGVDGSLNLYVADNGNNRVLKYSAGFGNGASASAVLGQPGFLTGDANHNGLSATSLSFPFGLGLSAGSLYVADRNNHRVLEYALPVTTNKAAGKVFGQGSSFLVNTCNGTGSGATNLCFPTGVVPTSTGDLYIADWNNNRLLEYTHPLVSGQPANMVFGQGGLFNGTSVNLGGGPNAEGLNRPLSVTVDSLGNLYAADTNNNRALLYLAPLAKPSPTPVPKPATVAPTTLPFGIVVKGTFSASHQVKLTNTAATSITVNAVDILGPNRINFAQNNNCVGALAGGSSCTISVLFMPTAPGGTAESATLTIYDTASNSPQTVALSGTSLAPIKLSATSLPFGNQTVGVKSAAKPVTVTNNLSTTISIKVTIGGLNPGDFAQTNTCGASLLALKSCTISVTFKPTVKGARSAALTITDSPDVDSPHNVSLSGTGT